MSDENELQEQVRVQIRNKAAKYVVETIYNAIKNAKGVKYFFEGAGLTKTGVDGVITNVRRSFPLKEVRPPRVTVNTGD